MAEIRVSESSFLAIRLFGGEPFSFGDTPFQIYISVCFNACPAFRHFRGTQKEGNPGAVRHPPGPLCEYVWFRDKQGWMEFKGVKENMIYQKNLQMERSSGHSIISFE
jgi:hypothetical protein